MQSPIFYIGSLLFVLLGMLSTHGNAQQAYCGGKISQDMYLYIQKNTKFKDFHLVDKFYPSLHYRTKKVATLEDMLGADDKKKEGRKLKLFYAEAKNHVPINIYYDKKSKYIFMIEIIAEEPLSQFCLRDFLLKNGTDIGNLNCYLGKYREYLEKDLGSGVENVRISKKSLDYKTNFGIISFQISRDPQNSNKEWITGVRILFDNDW